MQMELVIIQCDDKIIKNIGAKVAFAVCFVDRRKPQR